MDHIHVNTYLLHSTLDNHDLGSILAGNRLQIPIVTTRHRVSTPKSLPISSPKKYPNYPIYHKISYMLDNLIVKMYAQLNLINLFYYTGVQNPLTSNLICNDIPFYRVVPSLP